MKINFKGIYNTLSGFMSSKSTRKTAQKAITTATTKPLKEKELFCHQYWQQMKETGVVRPKIKKCVELHGEIHGINHHLITGTNPQYMDEIFMGTKLTPRQMITKTDIDFKSLPPLEAPVTAYRCIGEKPDFFSEYKLYKKRLNTQKGDVINMREYSYSTPDMSYARRYLPNNRGILYEITYPEGAQVSRAGSEVVAPRSSKYRCTGTEHIKNDEEDFTKISLEYILPDKI